MCIPKRRAVIAIYGPTCVGKSTLATELSRQLNAPVRHCGDVLSQRARDLGVSLDTRPVPLHRAVDDDTRKLAAGALGILIVEGRYLNFVLEGVPDVKFVYLKCDAVVREQRFVALGRGAGTLLQVDQEDYRLCQLLYGNGCLAVQNWPVLDTDQVGPKELAMTLIERFEKQRP